MNRLNFTKPSNCRKSESGQAMVFVVLSLGLALIGAMALAIDLSHMWFRRQLAQTAADAACTAGAMDLLIDETNGITTSGHVTSGTNIDCNSTTPNGDSSGTSNPSACVYAALNGYRSSIDNNTATTTSTLGDNVYVRFDGAAPPGVTATPVMEVDVTENLPTWFAGLLQGKTSQTVRAISKCGIEQVASPIPLILLDPLNPDNKTSAFGTQGSANVAIYGGPAQSIQVNSSDTSSQDAVTVGGAALVDLTQGGPQHNGSSMGVTGGPIAPPTCNKGSSGFCTSGTGTWMSPHSPILDPLRNLAPPTSTEVAALATYPGPFQGDGTGTGNAFVTDGNDGCSAKGGANCVVFSPGNYPNGICLGTSCSGSNSPQWAVFREGLYYIGGSGLTFKSDTCIRMSKSGSASPYNGWGGAAFYFVGTATVTIDSNSGNSTSGCDAAQTFNTTTGGPTGNGVYCDSTAASKGPGNVPATLTGNAILAPCTGEYGDQNYNASLGRQRGILFFQDRSAAKVTAQTGGGGSFAMAGTMYFHSCNSDPTASTCTYPTGTYSSSGTYFLDTLQMGGNTGAQSYILGEIIVDNLTLQGGPSIYMDLSPSSAKNVYKAALYQ